MEKKNEKAVKPMSLDRERIGKQIRGIREQQKIDAKTLAEKAGIDSGNLCRIEQGKYSVGLDVLCKVAYPLGYKVALVPIVENKGKDDKVTAAKNKLRYREVPLEILKPIKEYDYQTYWVTSCELEHLGICMGGLSPEQRFNIEKTLTFARCVYFGNSRSIFNYGQLVGLYVYNLMAGNCGIGTPEYISPENREVIYSVCNYICNLISDDFVEEAVKSEDFEGYIREAFNHFDELTAKWMYMNGFTSQHQKYAISAAEYAISTRLGRFTVPSMLVTVFPELGNRFSPFETIDHTITEKPQRFI